MLTRILKQPENKYGTFFLATEAPDDEAPSRPNMKRLKISRRGGSRVDFAKDIPGMEESLPEEEETQTETEPPENTPDEEAVDFATGEEETAEEPTDDGSANAPDEEEADFANNVGEETLEGDGEEVELDTTEDAPDEEDVDFSAGGDEPDDTTPEEDQAPDDEPDDDNSNGPGIDGESSRKYNLFKEYMKLYASVKNYIDTMDNIILDGIDKNIVLKRSVDRLKSIKQITYDYMITKFNTVGYAESSLFFEKLLVSTQLAIKLLVYCGQTQDPKKKVVKKKK